MLFWMVRMQDLLKHICIFKIVYILRQGTDFKWLFYIFLSAPKPKIFLGLKWILREFVYYWFDATNWFTPH